MKKVLIPFDFGPVSLNALKYAFELFRTQGKFVIIHVIDGDLSLNDPLTYTSRLTRGDGLIHEMNTKVDAVIEELGEKIDYVCQVEVGSPALNLVRIAEKELCDLIVMGTRDKYNFFDKWLGTVSLGVIKHVKLPVYLVPKTSQYEEIKRVMIATDYHLESDDTLEYLIEWNKEYKADMHFVHILDGKGREGGFFNKIVEQFFEKRNVEFPFTVIQKEKGDIADELIRYAESVEASLQIFVTDNMSWFESMISGGVTKKMIIKATKPMLFLPSGIRKQSQILFNSEAL